jgi:hypothetical protein
LAILFCLLWDRERPDPTRSAANQLEVGCNIYTVPLGGAKAVVTYDVTSTDGGTFTDTAKVTTGSTFADWK